MSLRNNLNIINNYTKKIKKSILFFAEIVIRTVINKWKNFKKLMIFRVSRIIASCRWNGFFISYHKFVIKNTFKSAFSYFLLICLKVKRVFEYIQQKLRKLQYILIGDTPQIRIDIFIVIILFFFIASPFIVNVFSEKSKEFEPKQVIMFLSRRSEDLLGIEITERLLQEFNELNSDIVIRLEDPLYESLPDILIFDDGGFNAFTAAGSLIELSTLISTYLIDTYSIDNYSSERQFAIPLVSFMDLLFYNIEILKAAGFDSPPKTRDEFLAYARAVTNQRFPGVSGAAISLNSSDPYSLSRDVFSWMWAAGDDFISGEDGSLQLPGTAVNDITFLKNLYLEGLLAPRVFETTGDQRLEEFANGQAAMMIASSRVIPYLRQRMGDSVFGITTIPDPVTGGRYNINISAIYAGISTDCEYPEEALRFLEFIIERSIFLCEELEAVPGVVTSIIPGDYVENDPFYTKAWDIFESAWIINGFYGNLNAQNYERAFLEELMIFLNSNRTAQQTLTVIQQRWDETANFR